MAKGATVLGAGQFAKIAVTVSTPDMDLKGFDTEGITPYLAMGEAGKKPLARSIQMDFVLHGVAHEKQASVQYGLVGKNGEAG